MKKDFKIWMGGITRGPVDIFAKNRDAFDGAVFTVDSRVSNQVIDEFDRIGYGVLRDFQQAHDWRANDWLHAGYIKPGDWVCILDTTDELNEKFKAELRENIGYWDKNGVSTVYLDRPFLFKFTGHQYFEGTPHWGVQNLFGSVVNLSQLEGYVKENYLINNRDSVISGIEHPIKYYIEYKRSNHTQLLYAQFGAEVYRRHEQYRLWFQNYVETTLGIECTVDNLVEYIRNGIKDKKLPTEVIEFIETEVAMQDLVRYHILGQDFLNEIAKNRFNWSFKKFYFDGVATQGKYDGFVGLFNHYRGQLGKDME